MGTGAVRRDPWVVSGQVVSLTFQGNRRQEDYPAKAISDTKSWAPNRPQYSNVLDAAEHELS